MPEDRLAPPAPRNHDAESQFLEALPEWVHSLRRTEIAAEVAATDDAISIHCNSQEGADVFEAVRPELEQALPSGYRLVITE